MALETTTAPIAASSELPPQSTPGAEANPLNASVEGAAAASIAPAPTGAANASSPELASPVSPSFEFEPNVTLSTENPNNASIPALNQSIPEQPQNQSAQLPPGSLPLKPLSGNETAVDLGAAGPAGKNESDLLSDLLSNSTAETGDLSQNATPSAAQRFLLPSKIEKLRLTVIGFTGKPVHTFNLTEHQVLYQMKVFWGEPDSWQDIGWRPSDRLYELFCWLTTNGGFARDLFRGNLSASLDQHSQWYAFAEAEDNQTYGIAVNCGIRPVNGAGKAGEWSFSDPANVREAPVFLRGFENVNVRGWTKEEVIRLIRNQKRQDSPQPAARAQSKTKAKNRRAS